MQRLITTCLVLAVALFMYCESEPACLLTKPGTGEMLRQIPCRYDYGECNVGPVKLHNKAYGEVEALFCEPLAGALQALWNKACSKQYITDSEAQRIHNCTTQPDKPKKKCHKGPYTWVGADGNPVKFMVCGKE